ncbi:zinc ribbon domain-containing protein [Vibrio sp. ABG19]|uniref:zinc ribbon domain-containing protein n=1 Tax=Vibrio sp. ABG19 TaxID=2817385 RepID=UPI00249F5A04|nr:zinc ribbon domain-containing protein [Vibrio sp. ABG19]WGY46226.1 zinc ribbon domain-containing protein [Vibrio sp. ABG19]
MNNSCPRCKQELEWDGHYYCKPCQCYFDKVGFCPDCAAAMEKLQACGAASYFCNQCNELKSKSRVRFEFQPAKA